MLQLTSILGTLDHAGHYLFFQSYNCSSPTRLQAFFPRHHGYEHNSFPWE